MHKTLKNIVSLAEVRGGWAGDTRITTLKSSSTRTAEMTNADLETGILIIYRYINIGLYLYNNINILYN